MIKFVGSFEEVKSLPKAKINEYAFIGRSNVGKSSLINAVAGENTARTSKTPGRTQQINLFNLNDKVTLVDLPGYGYARISKVTADMWLSRLQEYLMTRTQLKRLFILIDSRIDIKQSDIDLMDFCDAHGITYQVVLTKIDKAGKLAIFTLCREISCMLRPAMITEILETSASKKIGIERLREIIDGK